jgi:acetyltransferase AlgX (SGNH hydrolase-like protein)
VKPSGNVWRERLKGRLGLAIAAGLATASLYAEGVLKNGWIEVILLVPVAWYTLAPPTSRTLQNALLSLTAVCVTVTISDLLLRPVLDRRLNYTALNVYSHRLPALPIVGRWDGNLNLVDVLYGDLAAMAGDPALREPREIVFQTDAAGFRNATVAPPIDLIVLGDSFGAGWGTTQDRIYARLLETRYGRRVYNLSFPGGPYDQYVNFAIESPKLHMAAHATVVWTFFTGNDLDDAEGQIWDIDALPWKSGFSAWKVSYRTFRNRSPLNRLMEGLRGRVKGETGQVIRRTLPNGQPMLFHRGQEVWGSQARPQVEEHAHFPSLLRTMQAMKQLIDRTDATLLLLVLPTKGEVYRWIFEQREPSIEDARSSGFAQAVMAACDRLELRCLDTKPYLVEEARRLFQSSGQLLWWRDDTHLGEQGHAAVAAFIAQHMPSPASQAGTKQKEMRRQDPIRMTVYTKDVDVDDRSGR